MMRENMGGGLPISGFYEMKQDVYDIVGRLRAFDAHRLANNKSYCKPGLEQEEIVNTGRDQKVDEFPVKKARGGIARSTSFENREISSVLLKMPGHLRTLLEETQRYLRSLGEEVTQSRAQRYYSYKVKNTFAVVIPDRTRVIINLRIDPKTVVIDDYFTRDLHGVHSYGPASLQLQLFVRNEEQLEDAKKYMRRAFDENR